MLISEVDLEELQLQLEKKLCEVSHNTLTKLAIFFKLDEGKYQAKSKLSIARLLRTHVEEGVSQFEDDNECRTFLDNIKEQLSEVTEKDSPKEQPSEVTEKDSPKEQPSEVIEKDSPKKQTVDTELEVLKAQLDNLGKDHQKQLEALQTKIKET